MYLSYVLLFKFKHPIPQDLSKMTIIVQKLIWGFLNALNVCIFFSLFFLKGYLVHHIWLMKSTEIIAEVGNHHYRK